MPTAQDSFAPAPATSAAIPEIRQIHISDLNWALAEEWKDFSRQARRREEGRDSSWWHFLDPLSNSSRLPLAIGLAVVLPWLGYATWHLYTKLVVR